MAASSLLKPLPPFTLLRQSPPPHQNPKLFAASAVLGVSTITCGPRDNRGPLLRGRTLSTEAILAVQSLKRAAAAAASNSDSPNLDLIAAKTLSRLIKADLLAALAELQRQNQWRLALTVFSAARREPWYSASDFSLYAEMVAALARSGSTAEIDSLVSDLIGEQDEGKGGKPDVWGLARLVKALVAAGKGKAVGEVYSMMKRAGCVPDEFLFRVLTRGLRRLGEETTAEEVEKDFEALSV